MTKSIGNSHFGATIIELVRVHTTPSGAKKYFYLLQCDSCGEKFERVSSKFAKAKSGCPSCRKQEVKKNSVELGWKHPLYRLWAGMLSRCHCAEHEKYKDYGGRGIFVCDEWRGERGDGETTGTVDGFKMFLEAMGPRPTPKHSVGRIDNDGGYTPINCAWQTQKEQMNNTRRNVWLVYEGEQRTLAQWAEHIGMNAARFRGAVAAYGLDRAIPAAIKAVASNERLRMPNAGPTFAEQQAARDKRRGYSNSPPPPNFRPSRISPRGGF